MKMFFYSFFIFSSKEFEKHLKRPTQKTHHATEVEAAVQKAALVAHEAIIPGTGSILYDGAEVSGKVKTFNEERSWEVWEFALALGEWGLG